MKKTLLISVLGIALFAVATSLTDRSVWAEPISGIDNWPESSGSSGKNSAADAVDLFKTGDYEGSLKLWREMGKGNPEMPPAQTIMAQLFLGAGMIPQAQEALDKSIREVPNDPQSYIILASLALQAGEVDKAESLLQKAEKLLPAFRASPKRKEMMMPDLYRNFAMVAESRKNWPAAQKAVEKALELNPKNVAALQRIAFYLFQQGQVDAAMEKLREMAKANPDMAAPEALLAQFYQGAGDAENSKKWMDAAVKASPKNLPTRIIAGYAALEANNFDDVRKHAIAAANIDSKNYDAKMLRGLASVCQKDFVASELFFDSALEQSPNNFIASNNLALSLIEQDDQAKFKRATDLAEANVNKFPDSSSAWSTYGWVLYKLGRLEEADKALKKAASKGPVSIDTAYYIARLKVDQDHKDEALKTLEEAFGRNQGISMYRDEATELLDSLKK